MRLSIIGVAAIVATLASSAAYAGPVNLVVNPGFESGDLEFTSSYMYQSDLTPPATYYTDSNSLPHNPNWGTNVTPFAGNEFMIVNGDQTANVAVWGESGIAVLPDTIYYFSTEITSLYSTSPAALDFSINGAQIGSIFSPSSAVGTWQLFDATWYSGTSTAADISIVNQNLTFTGNDFGLDNISLGTTDPVPVPEPLTLSIFGAGLLGAAAVCRRKKAK